MKILYYLLLSDIIFFMIHIKKQYSRRGDDDQKLYCDIQVYNVYEQLAACM